MSGRKKEKCIAFELVRARALDRGLDVSDDEWELLTSHPKECENHNAPRTQSSIQNAKVLATVRKDPGILQRNGEIARQYLEAVYIPGEKQ